MKYSLSNPLHRQQLQTRLACILKKQDGLVELREVKPQRSIKQNRYLWLILSYFGLQIGYTKDEAEDIYKYVCKETYSRSVVAPTGEVFFRQRHTYELTTDEMSASIDRFRTYASQVAGVYLPTHDDLRAIEQMELEVERAAQYL